MNKENRDEVQPLQKPKRWLQKLKDESWEAELLASTLSIFGSFKLFDLIGWLTNKLIDLLPPNQYLVAYFITFFGLLAISILISMFVIHFFLRAYWIGLVGLNSVFPDYSINESAYSKIYTEKMLSKLPKLKDSIQKIDELCSVIFSVAFSFLLTYAYVALFNSIYLLVFNLLSDYVQWYILLIPAFFIAITMLIQIVITMLANLKSNKANKTLQTGYFKITLFSYVIMFGPTYKAVLQVFMIFGSNFKKKKHMVYLLLSFLLFGVFTSVYQLTNTNIWISNKIW